MKYKKYEGNAYNIYTVKTNRFKSCILNVVFKDNVKDFSDFPNINILNAMMRDNNKTYNKHRDLVIKKEELYNASFYTSSSRMGNSYMAEFGVEFIAPEFIKEDNYLEDVVKFNFDMIMNPNVTNDEFDLKTFNLMKENLILSVNRIHENGMKYSIKRALQNMTHQTITTRYIEESDYQKISPSSLYDFYKRLINNSICEIYVVGNLDMDEIVSKIKKNFNLKMIKNHEFDTYVDNKKVKKVKITKEKDEFLQAHLVMGYNIDPLDDKEKLAFNLFKIILGGGMNSKLYQKLRVDNSLCYSLSPIYFKYDRLMLIHVSFDEENYNKCVKLINESIKEIKSGKVSEEEFDRAIKFKKSSLKMAYDNIDRLLNNYIIHNCNEVPLINEYEEKLSEITLDDVIKVASKLTPNFVYLLGKGDNDNGKN